MKIIYLMLILSGLVKAAVISGNVTDRSNGEYVIGGAIAIYEEAGENAPNSFKIDDYTLKMNPVKGAYTNKYGFYSLPNLPEGEYILLARSISYEVKIQEIEVLSGKNLRINIELEPQAVLTDEVLVTADRETYETDQISKVSVDPSFIKSMPSIGSEVDIFRALQLLPGVSSASELGSGLYIRGGSPDQNLILLDDVIVYNPTHMAGFLSAFNADAISDIDLYKGNMPGRFGGRMSSVLDMKMKEGNYEEYHGAGSISLIGAKATVEGPITENSSFMISGRRFYLDLMSRLASGSDTPQYYFYDLYAKVNYKFSDDDQIFVSGFLNDDVFDIADQSIEAFDFVWGNSTFNVRWKHIFSPVLFSNFSLIYTNYNSKFNLDDDETSLETQSDIRDVTLKGQSEYFGIDKNLIRFGFELSQHNFLSRLNTNEDLEDLEQFFGDRRTKTLDGAIYLTDEISLTSKLELNLGGRVYYFQEGDYTGFEPRIATSYQLTDKTKLIGSYSVAHQFVHLITRNDISLPTDLWFPSTETILPSRGEQSVLGIHTALPYGLDLQVEGYYKHMNNVYEYKETELFTLGAPLDDQFTSGFGWAYGVEFFLHKKIGNLQGWVGYTWSKTQRKFAELNNGKSFFPRFDRRHDISITTAYKINDRIEIGANWIYATGQAYTMPNGAYLTNDNFGNESDFDFLTSKYTSTERNGFRLPAYHRLDLNFIYKYEFLGIPVQWSINIYNAYNRRNPFAQYVNNNSDYDPQSGTFNNKKEVVQLTLFPIIPTAGFRFEF